LSAPTVEYLSHFDVLQIRTRLASRLHARFDMMNVPNLQSALAAPRQVLFGEEMHPSLWDKAATLLVALIRNHPFYDGNKRIAMEATSEFLRRNGWTLGTTPEEATAFTTAIATHEAEVEQVEQWLREHAER
jgi:death on curing protein